MSEAPVFTDNAPNKREKLPDNARKFVVTNGPIDEVLLQNAVAHNMVVDWTAVGNGTETKVAWKQYDDGRLEILRIAKEKDADGKRTADKNSVDPENYGAMVTDPIYHLEKRRYEFTYRQGDDDFLIKYDVLEGGVLYLLEVDALDPTDTAARKRFDPDLFEYSLHEVSGDSRYEGYEIVKTLAALSH